jgi:drug/metabolite transporter (DMT)-like permease
MIKNLVYVVLIIAAALTLGSMFKNMGGIDAATVGFMVWTISPYALLAIATLFMSRFAAMRLIPVTALIAGVVMAAFAYYAYWMAMDHTSSTEALVYVVVPLYMNAFGVLALAVGSVVSYLATRKP